MIIPQKLTIIKKMAYYNYNQHMHTLVTVWLEKDWNWCTVIQVALYDPEKNEIKICKGSMVRRCANLKPYTVSFSPKHCDTQYENSLFTLSPTGCS